ncbi:hypothetical protein [Desulfofustis glycolicus]|uniref:DUF2523 domain-containing protein n=1 Tax=Desulfofustis glycolicus DSM 9705 TaxID=1121409 RepID=A0A1M5SFI9_9BACT|nr:hypothetical protein [Desulfofustis glycolicus]MCB2216112.1 hypothetical protein [Desulfobulbaceae bacterium]SHH37249.1 hypothetical protein SAMN02745124_00322 [Desulfofustis glycolicus DSM 9705]
MSNLINLIKSIPGMIWDAVLWIFENVGNLISWVFFTIYDGLLTVLYSFAAAIDFSAVMFNAAAQYSSMPSQLIWLINQIGLPQGFTYLGGAIVIRMLLNLLPAAITRV